MGEYNFSDLVKQVKENAQKSVSADSNNFAAKVRHVREQYSPKTALPAGVQGPVQSDKLVHEALKQVPLEERADFHKALRRQYPTAMDNVKSLVNEPLSGLSNANHFLWQAADFFTPDESVSQILGVENKVGKFFDDMYAVNAAQNAKQAELRANADKWAAKLGEYVVQPVVQAAPNAIIAGMTGGASLAGSGAALGGAAATSSSVAGMAVTSAKELMKNPSFWVSFAQTAGPTYFDAKENGAGEIEATATALLNAFAGSAIEVSGGIETLPNTPMGVKQWVKSALEEGGEEVLQGITEGLVHKAIYDADREWASWTDPDAVFSGTRALQEYAGGVVVGGVLGGTQIGAAAAAESVKNYAGYIKLGNSYLRAENGQTIDDALRIGFSNAKGTEWYRAAETIQQKEADAEKISPYAVGRMVIGSFTPEARTARAVDLRVRKSAETLGVDEQTADAVARVAVATSTPIEFVSPTALQVAGENGVSIAEGRYVDGKVQLNASMPAEQLTGYLLAHELTHSIQDTAQWRQLERLVHSYYGDAAFESAISAVTEKYAKNNTTLSRDGAVREVVAQWVGQNLFRQGFAQAIIDGDATVGNAFLQVLDKVRLALGGTKNSRTASNIALVERLFMRALENRQPPFPGNSGYSINKNFFSQLTSWDKQTIGFSFVVGETSEALQSAGIPKKQIRWDASKISTLLKKHSGMTIETIAQIPSLLENPVIVIDSKKEDSNSKIVMGDLHDANGKIVTVVLLLTPTSKKGNQLDLVKISSAEGRSHIQSLFYNDGMVVPIRYIDKKRIRDWLNVNRLQLPLHNLGLDSNTTIPQDGTGVNSYDMQNGGENSQFSFGDGSNTDIFGTSAGEATPIGNETAVAEAEAFAADADDIAVGHSLETTPPIFRDREQARVDRVTQSGTRPDKGRQGDAANSQALGNFNNVVDLSFDSELAKRVAGLHGSAKYTIIQNYVLEVLGEQPIALSDGKQAIVDKSDARHVAKLSGDKKTAHIAKIKELVESAVLYAEDTQVEHNKFDYFCYYRADVRLNGETFPIYLNVGRAINDGKYHLYDITQKIRDTANRIDGFERPKPNEGYALENGVSIDSIRNSAENVKENPFVDNIPDAEDAVAEVERKVAEKETAAQKEVVDRQQRLTKAEREIAAERVALREQLQRREISNKEFDRRQQQLDIRLREETAHKYRLGDKYDAKARAVVKNAGAEYRKTVDQRNREKRMAKKCTEIRRSIHTTVDELTAKLARPSKNRFIPPDLVSSMQEFLALFEETPESIDNRVFELKKKILEATDEGKKARLQKRLENLQNRNRLARENVQKIKIAYGKFCEKMSYGGEQHKFAVQKIKEDLDKLTDALFDTHLDDMSYEDLRNVFNVVRGVAFQVNNAQKLFCAEHRGELQEQGELGIEECLDAVSFLNKGLLRFDGIKKLVNWQLSPDRFFKMLGGFKKDSVWERVYNSFKEGQKRYFSIQREFNEFFEEITNNKAFERLADTGEKHLVDVGLKDADGKPVLLTRGMMLSLYMQLSCNMEQVIYSGLKIPALKTYYEYGITKDSYKNGTRITATEFNNKLWELTEQLKTARTPDEQSRIQEAVAQEILLAQQNYGNILDNIRGEMTALENDFITKAETWFNEISKNHINETTTQVFGYPKAMVERYFRIRRDTDFVETEIAGLAYNQTIESMGSLQSRVKSDSPMLLTDLMDELTANCNDVARIVGFMAPETDFRRLYNVHDQDMKHSVKEVLRFFGNERGNVGVSANQYIENLLADLTFGRKFEYGALGWAYRNSVRAVMTLNPRVALIQLAAGPTSAAYLGWKTWAKGAKYLFKKPPIDKINKYSLYGYMRNNADGGMQEFAIARQGHGAIDRLYNFVDNKTDGKVLRWCQKVDQGLVNSLWFTCEEKIRETRSDLQEGSEEYYRAVGELLDEVIIKTQSNGTTLEKPDLLRNKSAIMKPFTLFKTDTMQQFNILFESVLTHRRTVADFKAGKNGVTQADVREAKTKLANGITGAVVGGVCCATILRALANFLLKNTNKYRDEDGEITASSVALAATSEMLGSIAGFVTFGDYLYEVVEAQVLGERYYGISDMGLETVSELLTTIATADFSEGKSWGRLALDVTDALGIPANNVKKMFAAVEGHIRDIENGEFLRLNTAADASASQYYSRLYKALRDGDTARAERTRSALLGLGKTDAEILTGMRAAIRKSDDKKQKSIFEEIFADVRATNLYNRLTDEEKQKVQNGIAGYVADSILADVTGEKMTAAHQKAEKYAKRGVSEGDYFLAQVVKDALFADRDKDGEVSRAEYAEALEDGGYTARLRAMLLGLKK